MALPKVSCCENVYEHQEDSWLLQKAVAKFSRGVVLDLGCATGIAGITAALKKSVSKVVFADINAAALQCARKNAAANNVLKKSSFRKTNLFSMLGSEKFDVICFNPPYLPTEKGEKLAGEINFAFDGGATGRRLLDKFISQARKHLKKNGFLLVVSSSLAATKLDGSGNDETKRKLEEQGFLAEELYSDSFFFEKLVVFKAR